MILMHHQEIFYFQYTIGNFAQTVYQRCVRKEERIRRGRKGLYRGEGEGNFFIERGEGEGSFI
jgi:hypothetical protein